LPGLEIAQLVGERVLRARGEGEVRVLRVTGEHEEDRAEGIRGIAPFEALSGSRRLGPAELAQPGEEVPAASVGERRDVFVDVLRSGPALRHRCPDSPPARARDSDADSASSSGPAARNSLSSPLSTCSKAARLRVDSPRLTRQAHSFFIPVRNPMRRSSLNEESAASSIAPSSA